jgi:hypothetical protein
MAMYPAAGRNQPRAAKQEAADSSRVEAENSAHVIATDSYA